jgi:hypothetical protein
MTKSSVTPIQCSTTNIEGIQEHLPRRVKTFLVKYLGSPLSIKRLTKPQLQPLIHRLADYPPGWKVDLVTRAKHAIQVQFVLTAIVIYHTMALDLPHWAYKAIDKIQCSYMWRGRKYAKGGHCLVSWPMVESTKRIGRPENC